MKFKLTFLLVLLSALLCFGQNTGEIKGVVKDECGNPLPRAYVTVEGTTLGAQPDENGYYCITGLRAAGAYNLKCQLFNYNTVTRKDIKVKVNLATTVNFKLIQENVSEYEKWAKVNKRDEYNYSPVMSNGILELSFFNNNLTNQPGLVKDVNRLLHLEGKRSNAFNFIVNKIDGTNVVTDFKVSLDDYDYLYPFTVYCQNEILFSHYKNNFLSYKTDPFLDTHSKQGVNELSIASSFSPFIPSVFPNEHPSILLGMDFKRNDDLLNINTTKDYNYGKSDFGNIQLHRRNSFSSIFDSDFKLNTNRSSVHLTIVYNLKHNFGDNYDFDNFDWLYKDNPEFGSETVKEDWKTGVIVRHSLNRESYYDIIVDYSNFSEDYLPELNKIPDSFGLNSFNYNKYQVKDFYSAQQTDSLADFVKHREQKWHANIKYAIQIDKYNLFETEIVGSIYNLDYYRLTGPAIKSVESQLESNDPYPERGYYKLMFKDKPFDYNLSLKDEFEWETGSITIKSDLNGRYLKDNSTGKKYNNNNLNFNSLFEWKIKEENSWYFSAGTTTTQPSFTNLYTSLNDTDKLVKPERVESYAIGVIGRTFLDLPYSTEVFYHDMTDLICKTPIYNESSMLYLLDNSGSAFSKGLKFSLSSRNSDGMDLFWLFNYTYSIADGNSPLETSNNYNLPIERIKEFAPLDWDSRHKFNLNIGCLVQEDFVVPITNNLLIRLETSIQSGKPFTPNSEFYDFNIPDNKINKNSERLPWTEETNLYISKAFKLGSRDQKLGYIRFDCEINNLFNTTNILKVYPATGSWHNPGNTILSSGVNPDVFANPANISTKRHYLFGLSYVYELKWFAEKNFFPQNLLSRNRGYI